MKKTLTRKEIDTALRETLANRMENGEAFKELAQERVAHHFGKRELTGDEKQMVDEALRVIAREMKDKVPL